MDRGGSEHEAIDELTSLADELLEQASEVRRQWAELSETLGVEPPEPAPAPAPAAGRKAQRPVPKTAPPAAQPADADPVRLVALDMMLSGRSREEVRDYLRATFGEGDRDDVLDEIFTQYSG
jgi:hypothetical protein